MGWYEFNILLAGIGVGVFIIAGVLWLIEWRFDR